MAKPKGKSENMIVLMRRCKTTTGLQRLCKGVILGRGKQRVYNEVLNKLSTTT